MADVIFDGTGAPISNPSIVVFDGVGVPVATANRPPTLLRNFNNRSPFVSLGAANAIFPAPGHEEFFDGVGVPIAVGNRPGFPSNFDNRGKNVSFGASAAIFPSLFTLGDAGIPVGTGNKPTFPVTFDNQGKNVVEVPQAGPPVGTILWKETTFVTGPILNVGNN